MIKIVFMGTPEFAVPSLRALVEAGYNVELVVTQPDKKGNRGKVTASPVKQLADEYGIEIAQPAKIRKDEEFLDKLRGLEPDLIVVAAFGQILPEALLNIPKYGCINVHGSLLPELRGASPMQAAILSGCCKSGVTIMKMEKGLDTGDIISKECCNIEGMNISEECAALADIGAKLLVKTIPDIISGKAEYLKQDDELSSYASIIKKTDGMTDFDEPATVIERKIRAYYEWPNLYSFLDGSMVKFYDAEVIDELPDGPPGTVSCICKDNFTVNCREGKLKINELQMQGKKRMKAGDFMRGHKLKAGDIFTSKED